MAATTVALGMGLAMAGPQAANAVGTPEPKQPKQVLSSCFERETCFVTENNVIYRTAPWGTPLGQVNRGQGFDTIEFRQIADGSMWFRGNLWGGRSNVWINAAYLND
ncbi:SH3 domain-containing protein [Streptomyces sp. H10-C2]|uniref:SH3 domain-containing protein n=1 Tax=unclassified Streptomyces TaxID=2593676 RepID=UPI0024BB1288|nr:MULTISPECIES: SH3 domain-containing protein [unclassified Streptomyces]MDJ0347294.1 SH3 domain-containing protein [Streptomyces sp. PH10-H1]MDJ0375528.1 SH3 domain-containing protein [Streptomyces sp. H10-C2]